MNRAGHQYKESLIDEDLISLSNDKEYERINYYQQLMLRFLPFNIGISRLMKELAKESEARLRVLRQVSQNSDAQALSIGKSHFLPEEDERNSRHFFVIDSRMAMDILEQAWQEEYKVKNFYENIRSRNARPSLDGVLEGFIKQAKQQAHILQECKDQAFLLGQWRRDQGMLRKII